MSARHVSPALRPRPALALACVLVAWLASGCAGKKPHAAQPAPPPAAGAKPPAKQPAKPGVTEPPTIAPGGGQARPGYDRRVEPLAGLDTSPLRGRKIALDPGHGGRFPGSVGVRGLTEAEVNLGVALNLWGLLTDAGANVLMTRTADRDFTTPADSSLRADLAARVAKANAFDPDVFLSIHHNADAGARHDLNETQTYYKFTDPEASWDLGQVLHKHLALNLGVGADRLLPGNYFVVRNAVGAAALGESSYLTNPDVEARLALAAKQRLEAEAYFLGLVDYFRQGVPRITATRIDPITTVSDPPDGNERPWIVAVSDRAPGTARLVLDGAPVDSATIERLPASAAGTWTLRVRPAAPLTDGLHRVEWAVRAAGGNWSKARRDSFTVELPLARTTLEVAPAAGGLATGQIAGLTLRALDRHGRALADTVRARFAARVGAVIVDSLAAIDVPGEARGYARITGGSVADFSATLLAPRPRPELAEATAHITLAAPGGAAHAVSGFARSADGRPIAGARVTAGAGDSAYAVTNPDGFFALTAAPDSAPPTASAPGYVTLVPTGAQPKAGALAQLRLAPIAGGALIGHRIALDPAGGGADTTGMFALAAGPGPEPNAGALNAPADSAGFDSSLTAAPAGIAAGDTLAARRALAVEADANLRVARALREYLVAAGAQVVLTREKPDSLTAVDRLRVTEGFGAERVLSIAHRAGAKNASAGHYFSSPNGTQLAKRIAARLDGRGISRKARVLVSPSYLIQQTGAIAVELNLPDARAAYAEPTRGEARLREEAYALYLALLEDFAGTPNGFQALPVTVTRAGAPALGVPVTLDRRWTLVTDAGGRVKFDGLPAGAVLDVSAGMGAAARVKLPAPAPGMTLAVPVDSTAR
jgi:N-acetylmuramoyl-L-alanine amidase